MIQVYQHCSVDGVSFAKIEAFPRGAIGMRDLSVPRNLQKTITKYERPCGIAESTLNQDIYHHHHNHHHHQQHQQQQQ